MRVPNTNTIVKATYSPAFDEWYFSMARGNEIVLDPELSWPPGFEDWVLRNTPVDRFGIPQLP